MVATKQQPAELTEAQRRLSGVTFHDAGTWNLRLFAKSLFIMELNIMFWKTEFSDLVWGELNINCDASFPFSPCLNSFLCLFYWTICFAETRHHQTHSGNNQLTYRSSGELHCWWTIVVDAMQIYANCNDAPVCETHTHFLDDSVVLGLRFLECMEHGKKWADASENRGAPIQWKN